MSLNYEELQRLAHAQRFFWAQLRHNGQDGISPEHLESLHSELCKNEEECKRLETLLREQLANLTEEVNRCREICQGLATLFGSNTECLTDAKAHLGDLLEQQRCLEQRVKPV